MLGRRSYIDDILIPAKSWSSLYEKVERLLEVCDKWNLSISLTKRFWGCQKVDYLGHQVSLAGLEAHPKDLGSLVNIPFPRTLRSMQSFLGSLNYYSRFIEYFAIYASVPYELREADFYEIRRAGDDHLCISNVRSDPDRLPQYGLDMQNRGGSHDVKDDRRSGSRSRWEEAVIAFTLLKNKISTTPILKHFDPERPQ